MTDQPTQPDTLESIAEEMDNRIGCVDHKFDSSREDYPVKFRKMACSMKGMCILEGFLPNDKKYASFSIAVKTELADAIIRKFHHPSLNEQLLDHNDEEVSKAMHLWQQVKDMGLTVDQVKEAIEIYNDLPTLGDGARWNTCDVYFTPNPIWCDGDEYGTANVPFQSRFIEGRLQYIDELTYCDEDENRGPWSQVFSTEAAAERAAGGEG